MAITITCDGCGTAEGEMAERGTVRKRQYCAACTAKVDAYEAHIDEAHSAAAQAWADNLAKVQEMHRGEKDGLKELPDA